MTERTFTGTPREGERLTHERTPDQGFKSTAVAHLATAPPPSADALVDRWNGRDPSSATSATASAAPTVNGSVFFEMTGEVSRSPGDPDTGCGTRGAAVSE